MTMEVYLPSSESSLKHFPSLDIRMLIFNIAVSIGFVLGSKKMIYTRFKPVNLKIMILGLCEAWKICIYMFYNELPMFFKVWRSPTVVGYDLI